MRRLTSRESAANKKLMPKLCLPPAASVQCLSQYIAIGSPWTWTLTATQCLEFSDLGAEPCSGEDGYVQSLAHVGSFSPRETCRPFDSGHRTWSSKS